MNATLAILLPVTLFFLVIGGYLLTVFEPYFAQRTAEAEELKLYYAQDLKLHLIARWWAAKLGNSSDGWYDATNTQQEQLYCDLHAALLRHRFLTGDDPRKLRCTKGRLSSLLRRAQRQSGCTSLVEGSATMLVYPNVVKLSDGAVIWRGRPQEYRSRFNDMYDSYAES